MIRQVAYHPAPDWKQCAGPGARLDTPGSVRIEATHPVSFLPQEASRKEGKQRGELPPFKQIMRW